MNNNFDYDVIVIGAGVAGLQTARELRRKAPDVKLCVLEAKDRVGGRTYSVTLKTATGTDVWDLGGQWVGLTQPHLLALMKELDVGMTPQYVDGTKLAQIGGTKIRPYSDTLPIHEIRHYSLKEGYDFWRTVVNLEGKAAEFNVCDPFQHPDAVSLDAQSLQSWCNTNCRTRTVRDALDIATNVVFGTHADRLSLLYLMLYGRAAGCFIDTLEAVGDTAANSYKIDGGSQGLSKMMSDDLGCVQLNTPVIACEHDSTRVILTVIDPATSQLLNISCARVVFAIPPQQCAKIEFIPPLPDRKIQLFNNMPMGNLIKFIITYREPFWRNRGLSGEIIATGITDNPGEMRRPVSVTFDATTKHGNAALVGFINAEWADKTKDERRDAVVKDLQTFFGTESYYEYIDYEDIVWSSVPYNGGCPVAIVPPGCTQWYTRIREPVGRLHFAGTETATVWPGYITGACQSGLRAAHECLTHFAPQQVEQAKLEGSTYAKDYKEPQEPEVNQQPSHSLMSKLKWLILLGAASAVGYHFVKKRAKL